MKTCFGHWKPPANPISASPVGKKPCASPSTFSPNFVTTIPNTTFLSAATVGTKNSNFGKTTSLCPNNPDPSFPSSLFPSHPFLPTISPALSSLSSNSTMRQTKNTTSKAFGKMPPPIPIRLLSPPYPRRGWACSVEHLRGICRASSEFGNSPRPLQKLPKSSANQAHPRRKHGGDMKEAQRQARTERHHHQ